MERKILIEALGNVDPARSVTNSNEVMKTFWFTGKRVMAFDGGVALAVAFKSEFVGAIQATLLPLLASSGAPECTFEETDKGVTVKAGASKFKLLTMGADQFNFKFPKFPEETVPIVDVPKFLLALKACKRSLGSETSESAFKGVTIISGKGVLELFAYDRLTLTHCRVKIKGEAGFDRVVVPTRVVDQLIRISEGATELSLFIDDNIILARCGDVTLWGQLEDQDRKNRDFPTQCHQLKQTAKSTIDASDKDFMKKFPMMLERSVIISSDAVESTKLKITVTNNKIFFYSKSTRGVVEDAIMPPKGQKHHDIEVRLPPARLLAGLDLGSLSFTDEAAILSNNDQTISYYVSGD
jgi:DNA polymerase III sliding clamp (beta) subunit (PCNA family)